MTAEETPAVAVAIATGAIGNRRHDGVIREAVAALARAGWLHDPAEVERLRTAFAQEHGHVERLRTANLELVAALDAAPGTTAEGGASP